MSSIQGLPARGSEITILITKVHLHPLCVLVEFWAKFCEERISEYESLAKDIQCPGNMFRELEGNHGDQCLVQIDDTWYRCRIVLRNGGKYSVFLIDRGMTYNTTMNHLAWGKNKHFQLPPEVEYCVLANVLPLSTENRWSPVALQFLKSLSGKSVKAHVQDVLVAHRTFLLNIPWISKQMYEMGFARKLSPDLFQDFVLMSLQLHSGARVSPEKSFSSVIGEQLHKQEVFMYPEVPAGSVETVTVTHLTNPHRIFCQLKVFSKELQKLSEQLTQCCEGRMTSCIIGPEMIGFPCAARSSDGRWHRSVLQQVFPSRNVVEVLNVDCGRKQFVRVENVRPLATEFFRMPVVTYICSLYGIIDKGVGWASSQLDNLKSLLLDKTVIAKFEYQSVCEGVYYVTLYGEENVNLNSLFGSRESCLLHCEETLDYAIQKVVNSCSHQAQQERNQTIMVPPGLAEEKKQMNRRVEKLSSEDLALNSSHMAVVWHIIDPSEFWIQTYNYVNEFHELMDGINHLYKDQMHENVVGNPTVGLYCVAKAKDGDFYRARVAEVDETQIKVFFVDYGNTEVVDRSNIWTLPQECKTLPCLALKCSLAGIRPKDGEWSQRACEFFIHALTNKTVNVQVTAKYDEGYAVCLKGDKTGENDLGTLMCRAGFAERAETQGQPKCRTTTKPPTLVPTQQPDTNFPHENRNSEMLIQTLNTLGPTSNSRVPAFKESMFPIGSVLDVNVSSIESPNDFWCQLVQNAGQLKMLMHDIQAYYANSEFKPLADAACVARHPDNGIWYRALVIHKHETAQVKVLFVDYGQVEMVSLYDLRKICTQFVTLPSQAFRCSLLNPLDPTSATNEWNAEAISKFLSFVETAASNFVILKCTIYAVMYSEHNIIFNIVDLETPFESVSTSMVNTVKHAPPKKCAGPSFRLDTYYYSMHNIKIGTEEQVTVTYVNNVRQFYCQLEKNADVIKDLKIKVSNLCQQLESITSPTVFGTVCFAKYTDGQWYRGQIKATKPVILVHFVDYGDTIEVKKSDLLPVPKEANDIMSVPAQAVKCSLSDVPANVPKQANSWFEANVTDCTFRALIVAREPDGTLLVEIYHGKTQINAKLKIMFQIEMETKDQVVYQRRRALESSAISGQKTVPKQATAEIKSYSQTAISNPRPSCQLRSGDLALQSGPKPLHHVCENGQKGRPAPLELYKPPHQRQLGESPLNNTCNSSMPAIGDTKTESRLPVETKRSINSDLPKSECNKKGDADKLPKLEELPSKCITSGMIANVYVSHSNSPFSFYLQLVREEDKIISLVQKLNDPQSSPQTDIIEVHPGDLVQAEFVDDSSWYRAVIRETHNNMLAVVEFVDFGNTATTPISKMGRLDKYFLQFPTYSTHCLLSDTAAHGKEEVLDPKVVAAFNEDMDGYAGKMLKCRFIGQSGSMWEVSLEDNGVAITCKVPTAGSSASEEKAQIEENPAQRNDISQVTEDSLHSLCYRHQEFSAGQKLEVYIITVIKNGLTFWCQHVDSEDLVKIASSISEISNGANQKSIDPDSFCPGSPCIAVFSDDGLWYRAQVIERYGHELSVLFVDYGNTSKVTISEVRKMPPCLMETPPLAFLCELEGFDTSHGSWVSGAADELSVLTKDKVLQLTVTRLTRAEGRIKCSVQIECEGKVLNEALKRWWKTSLLEPTAGVPIHIYEASLQSDSSLKEPAPPPDQVEYPQSKEEDTTVDSEEQISGGLDDPQRAKEVPEIKGSKSSGDHLPSESPEEEREQKLRETCEMVNVGSSVVVCQAQTEDGLVCAGGDEIISPQDNKGELCMLSLSCDENPATVETNEEEDASVMRSTRAGESPTEAVDGSQLDLTSLSEMDNTCTDRVTSSDAIEQSQDTIARHKTLSSTTSVKMVPREALGPVVNGRSKDMQMELVPSSFAFPAIEQDVKAGDGSLKGEVPCATVCIKTDLMAEEENLTRHATNIDGESHTSPSTCPDQAAGDEEVVGPVEEAHLTDICTAPPSESEHQEQRLPSQQLRGLVEKVTCCVGEICLADVCRDAEEKLEGSEPLVPASSEQAEDFSEPMPEEEVPSSEGSFEAQLTKVTHLSDH